MNLCASEYLSFCLQAHRQCNTYLSSPRSQADSTGILVNLTVAEIYTLVLDLNCEHFACSSFAFKSKGLSKNLTRAGSFNREARICSNAKDHWCSSLAEEGVFSTLLSAFSSRAPESQAVPENLLAADLGLWSFLPTSSILSKRLVTIAMAWYSDSSSGSSWNKLYRVFENWINCD